MNDDPYDLQRFVDAQDLDYATALAELRAGRKRSHWIWYVLPQMAGLGTSGLSRRYGIRSLDEAAAYLAHPLLGPRLAECVRAINADGGLPAAQILGPVDAAKFRSCVTLFAQVAGTPSVFGEALARFFGGSADPLTLRLLAPTPGAGPNRTRLDT